MTEVTLVVIPANELRRLIADAVHSALVGQSANSEWVDAHNSGLGYRVFLRLARNGALPVSKLGKKYVARRGDVDAYIEGQRIKPASAPLSRAPTASLPAYDPIAAALAQGRLRIVKKPP